MGRQSKSADEAGKSDFYETFTSGKGPTIPDECEKDSANMDGPGLSSYTMNGVDDEQGSVPEVPSRKR